MPPTPEFKVIPSLVETIDRRGQNFQAGLGNARVSDIASITDGLQQGLKFGADFQAKVLETKRINDPETIFLDKVKKDLANRQAAEVLRQEKIKADAAEQFGIREASADVRLKEKLTELKERFGDREIESLINARNAQAANAASSARFRELNTGISLGNFLKRDKEDEGEVIQNTDPFATEEPGVPAPRKQQPSTDGQELDTLKNNLIDQYNNLQTSKAKEALTTENVALVTEESQANLNAEAQQRASKRILEDTELRQVSNDYRRTEIPQAVLDDNPAAGLDALGKMNSAYKQAKTPEAKQAIASDIQDSIEDLGGADALDAFIAQNAQSPDEQQLLGQIVRQAIANTGDINMMPQDMQNLVVAGLPIDKAANPSATYDDAANGLTSLEDIQDDDIRNTIAYDPYYAALTTATKNGTQGATMSTEIVDVPQDIGGEGPAKSAVVRFKGSSGEPQVDMPPPATPKDKATINILKRVIERQAGRFQSNQGAQQAAQGIQQRRQAQAQQFAQPLPEQGGRAVVTPQGDIPITDAQAGAPAQQVPAQQQQPFNIPDTPVLADIKGRQDIVDFKVGSSQMTGGEVYSIEYADGVKEKRLPNGRRRFEKDGVIYYFPRRSEPEQTQEYVNQFAGSDGRLSETEQKLALEDLKLTKTARDAEIKEEQKTTALEERGDAELRQTLEVLKEVVPAIAQLEEQTGEKFIGKEGRINRAFLTVEAFTGTLGVSQKRAQEYINTLERENINQMIAKVKSMGNARFADSDAEKQLILDSAISVDNEVTNLTDFIALTEMALTMSEERRNLRSLQQGDVNNRQFDRDRLIAQYLQSGAGAIFRPKINPETGQLEFLDNPNFRSAKEYLRITQPPKKENTSSSEQEGATLNPTSFDEFGEPIRRRNEVVEGATFIQDSPLTDQSDSVINLPETRVVGEEQAQEVATGSPLDASDIEASAATTPPELQLSTDVPGAGQGVFTGTRTPTEELDTLQRAIENAPPKSLSDIAQTVKNFTSDAVDAVKQGRIDERTKLLLERAKNPEIQADLNTIKQELKEKGVDPGFPEVLFDTLTLGKSKELISKYIAPVEAAIDSAQQAVSGKDVDFEGNLQKRRQVLEAYDQLLDDRNFETPAQKLLADGVFFAALDRGIKSISLKGLEGLKTVSPGLNKLISFLQTTEDVVPLNRLLQKGSQFAGNVAVEAVTTPIAIPQEDIPVLEQMLTGAKISAGVRASFGGLTAIAAPLFDLTMRSIGSSVGSPDKMRAFADILRRNGFSNEELVAINQKAKAQGVSPMAVLDDNQRKVVVDIFSAPAVRQQLREEAPSLIKEADAITRASLLQNKLTSDKVRNMDDVRTALRESGELRLKTEADLVKEGAVSEQSQKLTRLMIDASSSDEQVAKQATTQLEKLVASEENININTIPKSGRPQSLAQGIDNLTEIVDTIDGNLNPIYTMLDKKLEGRLGTEAIKELEQYFSDPKNARTALELINHINSGMSLESVTTIAGSIPNSFKYFSEMYQALGPKGSFSVKAAGIAKAKEFRTKIANTLDAALDAGGLQTTNPKEYTGFFTEWNAIYSNLAKTSERLTKKINIYDDLALRLDKDNLPTNLTEVYAGNAKKANTTREAFATKEEFNIFKDQLKSLDKVSAKINAADGLKVADLVGVGSLSDDLTKAWPILSSNNKVVESILKSTDPELLPAVIDVVGPSGRDLLAEGVNRYLLDGLTDFIDSASGDELGRALGGKLTVLGLTSEQVNNIGRVLTKEQLEGFTSYADKKLSFANMRDILETQVSASQQERVLPFLFRRFLETQGLIVGDITTSKLFQSLAVTEQRAIVRGLLKNDSQMRNYLLNTPGGNELLEKTASIINKDLFERAAEVMKTRQTPVGPITEILPKTYPITADDLKIVGIGYWLADDRLSKEKTKKLSAQDKKAIKDLVDRLERINKRRGGGAPPSNLPSIDMSLELTPQEQRALAGDEI